MKKYIVCVNNMMENDMRMVKVEADSEKEAIVIAFGDSIDMFENFEYMTVEDIQEYYFDADTLISDAVEI